MAENTYYEYDPTKPNVDWKQTQKYEGSGYNAEPGKDPEMLEKDHRRQEGNNNG